MYMHVHVVAEWYTTLHSMVRVLLHVHVGIIYMYTIPLLHCFQLVYQHIQQ